MRVVLFGTNSPFTLSCLEALRGAGHPTLFVMLDIPLRSKFKRDVLRRWPPPQRFARRHGIPVAWFREEDAHDIVAAFEPDILCIATFKRLIPASLAALAPLGAINLHPSLLPRQRGPQTLFRVYHDGDAETGLTVHRATPRFDAGPIVLQEALTIPRGYPVDLLSRELSLRSGPMLARALHMIAAGAPEYPQDDAASTPGTRFDPARFRVPLHDWPVEQSWHFLAGFCTHFKQPLTDTQGAEVRYRSVGTYRRSAATLPVGTAEPVAGGWRLHCNGGLIDLWRGDAP